MRTTRAKAKAALIDLTREPERDAKVRTRAINKTREGDPKRFPRHRNMVTKVTECRETEDQLIRDMLEATASVVNCTGGTNGDNPTEIVRSDVDGVVATLQNNNAEFITERIEGEDRFGTGPVRDCYLALGSTNLIGQLENVNGFIAKAQYPNDSSTIPSEWGSIGNLRFFLSSRGSMTGSASMLGADVYNIFVVGEESYCSIDLDGASAQFIYHPAGWGDDPCELRQTSGFRFAMATRVTNDAWVINLRTTLA